jgi:hypothetical protein
MMTEERHGLPENLAKRPQEWPSISLVDHHPLVSTSPSKVYVLEYERGFTHTDAEKRAFKTTAPRNWWGRRRIKSGLPSTYVSISVLADDERRIRYG